MADGSDRLLFLSEADVLACGGMDFAAALQDVDSVLRLMAEGDCVLPSKVVLRWGDTASEFTRGRFNAMPAYVGGAYDMAGIKWIGSFPANLARGRARGTGLIVLSDAHSGEPLAVMNGTLISAVRTAAATAIATRAFAAAPSPRVGLIGAGAINRMHVLALSEAHGSLDRVQVFDLDTSRAARLAADLSAETGVAIEPASDVREAVEGMGIVIGATTATEPTVRGAWLAPGAVYVEVGGRNLSEDGLRACDRFVADNWVEVWHRYETHAEIPGTFVNLVVAKQIPVPDELGAVLLGRKPGRRDASDRIFVKPVGMGTEDVAVAARVYRAALAGGIGTWVEWGVPTAVA